MTDGPAAPWGGRFERIPTGFQHEFGASLPVDRGLAEEDVRGSIAHARMLGAQGVISHEDATAIERGLREILSELAEGTLELDAAYEDVHMAIEAELTRRIGEAGKRLHTARSRNDQVATDTRLYAKHRAVEICRLLLRVRRVLFSRAETELGAVMPGYTHMQKAQPVLLSHHLLAYAWMFTRDLGRVRDAYEAADVSPLGSAALAGTTYPIDRRAVAAELGFSAVSPNSLDAVSDRDFLLDLVYACAVIQAHLSRLAEEIVLWSTEEFGFVLLDDEYSTGSSIMPQKRNPDFAELVRGKTGRVTGDLVSLLVTLKGLPLAYNKDMQEDKEAAFDAVDTVAGSLAVMCGMLETATFQHERMREAALGGFMLATDVADYLVTAGVPFREAHAIVGRMVRDLEVAGRTLTDLSVEEFRAYAPEFDDRILEVVDLDAAVARRISEGGTGHAAVAVQLERQRQAIERDEAWLDGLTV